VCPGGRRALAILRSRGELQVLVGLGAFSICQGSLRTSNRHRGRSRRTTGNPTNCLIGHSGPTKGVPCRARGSDSDVGGQRGGSVCGLKCHESVSYKGVLHRRSIGPSRYARRCDPHTCGAQTQLFRVRKTDGSDHRWLSMPPIFVWVGLHAHQRRLQHPARGWRLRLGA